MGKILGHNNRLELLDIVDLDRFVVGHPREDVSISVLLDLLQKVMEKQWKRRLQVERIG